MLACMCVTMALLNRTELSTFIMNVNRLCVGSVIALVLQNETEKKTTQRFDRVDGVAPHTVLFDRKYTNLVFFFFLFRSLTRHISVFFLRCVNVRVFVCADTIYMHRSLHGTFARMHK